MKKVIQNIFLLIGSVLFCLLVLEILFKGWAWVQPNQAAPSPIPGLPYENTPRAWFWRHDGPGAGLNFYRHNSFGMRGPETTREKPQGTLRIALLGDSVAHGGNVTQGRTTADYLVELMGERAEVLNFGVAGYDLREYAILVEKKVLSFAPDVVLVGLCLNDYRIRGEEDLRAEDKNSAEARRERLAGLFERSHLLQYLRQLKPDWNPRHPLGRAGQRGAAAEEELERMPGLTAAEKKALRDFCAENRLPVAAYMSMVIHYIPEYRSPKVWLKNENFIRRIIELCRDKNIPVYFFVYPLNEQIFEGWDDPMPQPEIRRIVERNGGRYLEMLEPFRIYQAQHPRERLYTRLDHMHLLKNGHRLVARTVADALDFEK